MKAFYWFSLGTIFSEDILISFFGARRVFNPGRDFSALIAG